MIVFIAVVVFLAVWGVMHRGNHAPCEPGDCKSCPFPLCSDEERRKNTGQS